MAGAVLLVNVTLPADNTMGAVLRKVIDEVVEVTIKKSKREFGRGEQVWRDAKDEKDVQIVTFWLNARRAESVGEQMMTRAKEIGLQNGITFQVRTILGSGDEKNAPYVVGPA